MYELGYPHPSQMGTTNWEQRFCHTDWCAAVLWVRRDPTCDELWHVKMQWDDIAYAVAATCPVCPGCGGDLLTAANLSEGVD
ncbi:MAG TPA: hypothetical protein VK003_01670 [Oceanobacillus sp.]|nr:hypothetical protein [Oceanobacillus sp.]